MKACLSSVTTPRREQPLTGDDGQLFLRGLEPADAAIDFISSTCRPAAKGVAGFSYILLYNESSPAALPSFLALVDSCRLYGEPGAISVASKAFPDPNPTIILNPLTSIISVRQLHIVLSDKSHWQMFYLHLDCCLAFMDLFWSSL